MDESYWGMGLIFNFIICNDKCVFEETDDWKIEEKRSVFPIIYRRKRNGLFWHQASFFKNTLLALIFWWKNKMCFKSLLWNKFPMNNTSHYMLIEIYQGQSRISSSRVHYTWIQWGFICPLSNFDHDWREPSRDVAHVLFVCAWANFVRTKWCVLNDKMKWFWPQSRSNIEIKINSHVLNLSDSCS